jgi:ribonuclease VapC
VIIDTSAIMAFLLDEPEKAQVSRALVLADQVAMSAGSWLELAAVLTRRGNPSMARDAELLFAELRIEIVPVSVEQAALGREGYRRYGRGTGHPAGLNFGDGFAYALARETGRPLLFKGDDFIHTDVVAAS